MWVQIPPPPSIEASSNSKTPVSKSGDEGATPSASVASTGVSVNGRPPGSQPEREGSIPSTPIPLRGSGNGNPRASDTRSAGSNPAPRIARRTPLVGAAHAGLNIEAGRAAPSSLRRPAIRENGHGDSRAEHQGRRLAAELLPLKQANVGSNPTDPITLGASANGRLPGLQPDRAGSIPAAPIRRGCGSVAELRFFKPAQDGFESLRSHLPLPGEVAQRV